MIDHFGKRSSQDDQFSSVHSSPRRKQLVSGHLLKWAGNCQDPSFKIPVFRQF